MPTSFPFFPIMLVVSLLLHAGAGFWLYRPQEIQPPRLKVQIGVASIESRSIKPASPKKVEQAVAKPVVEKLVPPREKPLVKVPAPPNYWRRQPA